MTLALGHEQLVLQNHSELLTARAAMMNRRRAIGRQPVALVVEPKGVKQIEIAENLVDSNVDPFSPNQKIVLEGHDKNICVRALKRVARSNEDSYHRAHSRAMLTEIGMDAAAKRAEKVSTFKETKRWIPKWLIALDEPRPNAPKNDVVLNPRVENMPPLTPKEISDYETVIDRYESAMVSAELDTAELISVVSQDKLQV